MRNWNWGSVGKPEPHEGRLPDYLWGIETPPHVWSWPRAPLPDYLWGIETHDSVPSSLLWIASRLPMRNWNTFFKSSSSPNRSLASRLPMRNWNRGDPRSGLLCFGFQTTYEELKQIQIRQWLPVVLCFQTTYEELKLDICWETSPETALPDYLWGIETVFWSKRAIKETASRLPMRNWNRNLFPLQGRDDQLPDYLWGIETSTSSLAFFAASLPDYLWGIETPGSPSTFFEDIASRLPMRNWNYDSNLTLIPDARFQTTYEELKLKGLIGDLPETGASRLPMRNWNERFVKELFDIKLLASRLPMRNWNSPRLLPKHLLHRFQTTYEELKQERVPL